MTDIEGVTNVDDFEMVRTNSGDGYIKACHELMKDTNAAIAGFYDAGADKVFVYDGHHRGKNFIKDELDPRATQIEGLDALHELVTSGRVDAYGEVGLHAMAGAENAFLEHTQSSAEWFDYKINGVSSGELIQGAAYVGRYGIPFVFVSGDEALCREAEKFIPGIATACVKQAKCRNLAISLPEGEARELIRKTAARSLSLVGRVKPYEVSMPAEVLLTFQRNDYCDKYADRYERVGPRTIKKTVPEILDYLSLLF